MMSSFGQDVEHATIDHFDELPDPILLLIFNNIKDIKALGKCSLVSKRFQTLVSQVHDVTMHIDCVISNDNFTSPCKPRTPFSLSSLIRLVFCNIMKPVMAFGNLLRPKSHALLLSTSMSAPAVTEVRENVTAGADVDIGKVRGGVTHHSPTEVLKNFNDVRKLTIELPSGELGMEDDVLVKWRAEFGSTLHNCAMLGASSVIHKNVNEVKVNQVNVGDDGSIPESFYVNGGLKLRVVWTISSLIAASARHYLLQGIIDEHKTLESLVLRDVDGQGVSRMNKEQLEELRGKPLKASLASKRTLVPALNMKLWYAPYLELGDGSVLKGATLVAIRPSGSKEVNDVLWASDAFEEPYGSAVRMLLKRRTYCLEMNSF